MLHDEIRAIVREELTKLFALVVQPQDPNSDQWVSLKEAVEPLGFPSYNALHKAVRNGVFRMDKELRDRRSPGSKQARLQINLRRAHKRLSEDSAKRRACRW